MSLVDPRQLRFRCIRQTRLLCRAGHFLQQYVPLCRRCAARSSEFRKRKAPSQHRAPHSAALSGVRTARGLSAGLGGSFRTLPTSWARIGTISIPPKSWMNCSLTPLLPASTTTGWKGTKSIQWPVAADGTDEPLSTRNVCLSLTERPGCFLSHGLAHRSAER